MSIASVGEFRDQRKDQIADPVLQQHPVLDAFEQAVPMMLMHINQPRHHQAAFGVDHVVEVARIEAARIGKDTVDATVRDRHRAAGEHIAVAVHRDDVAVLDENPLHAHDFPMAHGASVRSISACVFMMIPPNTASTSRLAKTFSVSITCP